MNSHAIVIHPFGGITRESERERLFDECVRCCVNSCSSVTLIYEERSTKNPDTESILKDFGAKGEVVRTWGVDTCQDWLTGWTHVLGTKHPAEEDRIVLLPGDLDSVQEESEFFGKLPFFLTDSDNALLVGDFRSENPRSPKELIDIYGVYPLVANWFPEAWQRITLRGINKPRTEFLNIRVGELRRFLSRRPFAYEQTLNMLLLKWDFCLTDRDNSSAKAQELWIKEVGVCPLGALADDPHSRDFRGAVDQIERTERMLRMVWRDINKWNPSSSTIAFRELMHTYEELDKRSTRIRDAAWIAIWSQLGY